MAESSVKNDTSYVKRYYALLGKRAVQEDRLLPATVAAITARKNDVIISSCIVARCIAKLRGIDRPSSTEIEKRALQYFALLDAFSLLQQKSVPVYYYQRISAKCETAHYSDNERRRMKNDVSFVEMLDHLEQYEADLKEIFGEQYSSEYVTEISRIPQVIQVDGKYRHEDYQSRLINVINGKRITVDQPAEFHKTVHVYGRCGAFGYAVEDKDTMPSILQQKLQDRGFKDVRVINHGLWGGDDSFLDHNFLKEVSEMNNGDIVVFYRRKPDEQLLTTMQTRGIRYRDFSTDWHRNRNSDVTFFDQPGHMNASGYRLLAEFIADDLIQTGFQCEVPENPKNTLSADALNQYLKSQADPEFLAGVKEYIDGILKELPQSIRTQNNGAIVMNCNPFTYGHRYLIDYASQRVDTLFIFVVEEDKSFFTFQDRFKMVVDGTADLKNVVVVPSGKFIISAFTFPEYFMKDYVKEKGFDVSLDVETFCKYIAPPLGIRTRFAGQEPLDPVTKNYNENMEKILPKYGMAFCEIPRLALETKEVINATRVRSLLADGDVSTLENYVPKTTLSILVAKYLKRESKHGEQM